MKISNCRYIKTRSQNPDSITKPRLLLDFVAMFIFSPLHFITDSKTYTVNPNSFLLIKKDTIYQLEFPEGIYSNAWIHFDADENDINWITDIGIEFNIPKELSDIDEPSRILREMCREKYSDNLNSDETANLYLNILFLKISDILNADKRLSDKSETFKQFSKLRAQIYSHPQQIKSIDYYAKSVSLSMSHFQHKYKTFFGNGIKKDITLSRIEYAKYLLASSHLKINTIANMCGYDYDVYFMKVFKEHTHLTPSQYRSTVVRSDEKFDEYHKFSPFYGKKT